MATFQSIKVRCPGCGKKFWAEVYEKTERVKCRSCASAIPRQSNWRGSWGCLYRIHGRRVKETGFRTKKEAQEKQAAHRKRNIPINQTTMVYQLMNDFLNHAEAHYKPSTYTRHLALSKHILPVFGTVEAEKLEPIAVQRYTATRLKEGRAPATVNRETALLKAALNFGVRMRIIETNPLENVRPLREHNTRARFLEPSEVEAIIDNAAAHLQPLIRVASETGLRESELLNLEWKDVELWTDPQGRPTGVVHLTNTRLIKNSTARDVPLTRRAAQAFVDLKKKRSLQYPDVVFLGPYARRPLTKFQMGWLGACDRAGVQGAWFHDLRAYFITQAIRAGADIPTIAKITGHKTVRVLLQRYARFTREHERAVIDKLDLYAECPENVPKGESEAG